jgi:drug/metabolite transporter (DMT)-like permease
MKISAGIRYMLLSTLFFAFMNMCVKYLAHIPAYEVIFFRALISGVMCLVVLLKEGVNPLGNNKKVLVLRGLAGVLALLSFFTTLQHIPLASAVTFQHLSPIFTAILAVLFLNERMHWKQWLYFALSFAGVFLIKGFDPRVSNFYLVLGVLSAVFSGLAYNAVRKLKDSDHPLVVVFYFPLICIPVVGPYTLFNWVMPVGWDWLVILLMGVFTQLGQTALTKAIQAEELSKITYLNYLGIIYALGLGFIFFGEVFTLAALCGMILVLSGVMLNIQYVRSRKPILPQKKES